MVRFSKRLEQVAKDHPKVDSYEFDPGNDMGAHWLHLKYPWVTDDGGSVHESTVKRCLEVLATVDKTEYDKVDNSKPYRRTQPSPTILELFELEA